MILNNIKTPEELYKYMDENIEYGYLGKDGNIYKADNPEFDDKWFDYYLLESPEEVIKNKSGICWDQVELERKWFEKNKFEYKTYFEIEIIINGITLKMLIMITGVFIVLIQ